MNRSETAVLLAKVSAFDQRTVGEADVLAWHDVLGDLDLADALAAVSGHYRDSTDRIMPADVRRGVRELRAERRRLAEKAAIRALPSRFETDEERDARIERGKAKVREALAPIMAKWSLPKDVR